MAQEPKTITLREPIPFGSQTISELVFKPAKAKHFRDLPLENPKMGDVLNVMAKICGQPREVLDELGTEDMSEVMTLFGGFTSSGPETGLDRSR